MTLVWKHAPYTEGTLLTLLALADWADDEGVCFPKISTLAKKARLSERGAQFCLKTLIADGAVEVEKESTGPGLPRTYRIGVQYLRPLSEKGVQLTTERGAVNDKKGCSKQHANKEEPSVEPSISLPSPSAPEDSFSLTPVNGKISNRPKKKKDADHRHHPFQKLIFKCYRYLNDRDPLWDASEAKMLNSLLVSAPQLDEGDFFHWLQNYVHSDNINKSDRPRMFLSRITSYADGPLNEYGKPKEEKKKGWMSA
jgi:hypothetical protein